MKLSKQDKALLIMSVTGLGFVALGLWALVSALSVGALRAWAGASVFVIPLAAFAGWRLGTRDSREHLRGIDKGIKSVMGAAHKTADLRAARVSRPVVGVMPTPTLRLPDPEIRHVSTVQGEVIDL